LRGGGVTIVFDSLVAPKGAREGGPALGREEKLKGVKG